MVITARTRPRTRFADGAAAGWLVPLALALLGIGLPTLGWRLLPARSLQEPRPVLATRLPPLGGLEGRTLARTVRLVDLELPAPGAVVLQVARPRSTPPKTEAWKKPASPVRLHWALAPRGGAAEATGTVEAPGEPGGILMRRIHWTPAGPYVLHLVAEGAGEPTEIRVGVELVSTPPPALELLLALLLGAPLVARLLRLALGSPKTAWR